MEAELARNAAVAATAAAQQDRMEAEASAKLDRKALSVAELARDAATNELKWKRTQLRRILIVFALFLIPLAVFAYGVFERSIFTATAGILGVGLLGFFGYRWCNDMKVRLLGTIITLVSWIVGFASAAFDLWDRLNAG